MSSEIVNPTPTRAVERTSAQVQPGSSILNKLPDIVAIAVLSVGALIMLLPFLWMFATSLRPIQESFRISF